MVLLNSQQISNFVTANVFGIFKSSDNVVVYKGQALTRRLIIVEGTLIAVDEASLVSRIAQIYNAYKNGAQLTAFDVTKQVKLKDINILSRRKGLNRVFVDIAMVFEEV